MTPSIQLVYRASPLNMKTTERIQYWTNQTDLLEQQIKELEECLQNVRLQNDSLEKEIESLNELSKLSKAIHSGSEKQYLKQIKINGSKEQMIQALEEALFMKNGQLQSIKEENKRYYEQNKKQKQMIEDANEELQKYDKKIQNAQERFTKLYDEYREIKKQNKQLQNNINNEQINNNLKQVNQLSTSDNVSPQETLLDGLLSKRKKKLKIDDEDFDDKDQNQDQLQSQNQTQIECKKIDKSENHENQENNSNFNYSQRMKIENIGSNKNLEGIEINKIYDENEIQLEKINLKQEQSAHSQIIQQNNNIKKNQLQNQNQKDTFYQKQISGSLQQMKMNLIQQSENTNKNLSQTNKLNFVGNSRQSMLLGGFLNKKRNNTSSDNIKGFLKQKSGQLMSLK
ncbi:hypothetical protein PPERSA_05673 [Pseudocohnilembus persalinus]|uniref:Uncharacterized protein n=1 Tax=Pseudocohnilembus persalinus TaxID=266149 RepID=A0A0V0QLV5_PSEPJ|nr:hypothetical protein PPERSA_05673 [Pseudocohnilembus persalinus]|eukprot:KRX03315.1 hypothetical protein PPERSA_05673 [Pseudocohnilembus persalinus]